MSTKTKLRIFDFDGTLVYTPGPDTLVNGVPALQVYDEWIAATSQGKRKWQGWWGRQETLCPPIFGTMNGDVFVAPPELLNQEVAEEVRRSREDKGCLTVLLTGRHMKMTCPETKVHRVRRILDAYGLDFDRYYFLASGQPTLPFKCQTIEKLLKEFPTIRDLEMWEDREEHVSKFYEFAKWLKHKQNRIDNYKVHAVYPPTPSFNVDDFPMEIS